MSTYRLLDADRIVETARLLNARIAERFPESGLRQVSEEVLRVAGETTALVASLRRPIWPIRMVAAFCILLVLAGFVTSLAVFRTRHALFQSVSDYLQGIEAALNEFVLLGLAILFFTTLEARIKRRRALRALHTLRSLAHIIDMHQLTKDPERSTSEGMDTPSSPRRTMTPFQLTRYLDYCSELLAALSKLAALYAQTVADSVVLSAVGELENMSLSMSRNIWQKIMILDRRTPRAGGEAARVMVSG